MSVQEEILEEPQNLRYEEGSQMQIQIQLLLILQHLFLQRTIHRL